MKTVQTSTLKLSSPVIQQVISEFDASNFKDHLEEINRHAGITPVSVDPDLYSFIVKCIRLHKLTEGDFDIFERSGEGGLAHNLVETNPLMLSVYLPHNGVQISLNKLTELAA